jgi:hypothetical protein
MENLKVWYHGIRSRVFLLLLGCTAFFVVTTDALSQDWNIDSLESIISSSLPLSSKRNALLILAGDYGLESPDKALVYVDSLYILIDTSVELDLHSQVRGYEAAARRFTGDFEESIRLHTLNYNYYHGINDSLHIAYSANNIGTMKMFQGQYEASQRLYHEALDIYKALYLEGDIADMNIGLGNLYSYL